MPFSGASSPLSTATMCGCRRTSMSSWRCSAAIMTVLAAAGHMKGLMAGERDAIHYQLQRFRYELVKAEMRVSLSKHDAAAAALGLKTLSELRGSWGLAMAAKVGMTWPDLLQRA